MPIEPARSQRIRKDLSTYIYRDEDHAALDELFQYQQTQPYYQWREAERVLGASVIVTNTGAFIENRSFTKRIKGRLVLPLGVHFEKAPKMTLMQGTQQLLWSKKELKLELSEEDPNAIFFDFENDSPDPVAAIRFQELVFSNVHRNPGQSIDMEVSFDSESFEGVSPLPQVKLITTTLLYQRSLGADDSGNGMVALPGPGGKVNITNGNHHVHVPLFSSDGKGISTNLSLHYNHWNASYRVAIDNMLFHNEDDPNDFALLDQHYHFTNLGYGWNHSYGMLVFPYTSPIQGDGENIAIPHAEVLAPDGNRLQFIESGEAGVFEPLHLSDAWVGSANLLLSMRLKKLETGWVLTGSDLAEYRFDVKGRLIEISTVLTRNSQGSLEPLKIKQLEETGADNTNVEITDSAGRITRIESPSFDKIQVTNAANQVYTLFHESKSRRAFVSREGSFSSRSSGLNGALLMNKIEFPESYVREFRYDRRTCYLNQLTINRRARVDITHFRPGNGFRLRRMPEGRLADFWGYIGRVSFGSRVYEWVYGTRDLRRQRLVLHFPPPVQEPFTCEKHYGYHIPTQTVRELTSVYPKRKPDGSREREEVFLGSFEYYVDRQRRATTRLPNVVTAADGNTTNYDYRRSRRFPGSFLLSSKSVRVKVGEVHTHRFRYLMPEEVLNRSIDPNNNITIYQYNKQRLLLSITYPRLSGVRGRARESWQYHPNGQLDSHRNKRGFFTTYEYEGTAIHNGGTIQLDPHNIGLPTSQTDFSQKLSTHQQYNVLGLIEKSFDPTTGAWTEQEYDGLNRVKKRLAPALKETEEGLPERLITTYEYDSSGMLELMTDNFGNKTAYAYSILLEPTTTTDVFGNSLMVISRNGHGAPIQISDAKGHVTTYEYDDHLGRKTKTISPEPVHVNGKRVVKEFFYSDENNFINERVGNTSTTRFHDGLGRVIAVQKDQQESGSKRLYTLVTNIKYPDKGFSTEEETTEFLPGGGNKVVQVKKLKRDEWGREIFKSRGLNKRFSELTTVYDFENNIIETISPVPDEADPSEINESNRPRQRFEYDSLNRMVSTTDALNVVKVLRQYVDARTEDGQAAVVEYTHGTETPNQELRLKPFSEPQIPTVARELRLLNRLGQVEKTFDFFSINEVQSQSANRLVRNQPRLQDIDLDLLQNPVGQQRYDARGLVIQSIDAEGVTRRYKYNEKGLKSEELLDTEGCTISSISGLKFRDSQKTPFNELDEAGILNLDLGNVDIFESADLFHQHRLELTHTVSFTYDANDNLSIVTEPSGKKYVKSYDELNRLLIDSHPQQGKLPSMSMSYDEEGRPARVEYQNGLKLTMEYRDVDRARTTQIIHPGFTGGSPQKATIEEIFDWDGKPLEKSDSRERLNCTYEYDELRNPKAEIHSEKDGKERYRLEHAYDQLGNRWRMKLQITGAPRMDLTYRYDPNLQLTGIRQNGLETNNNVLSELISFTYAKSGLPMSAYRSNGVSTHYQFDEIGRMISALDFKGDATPRLNKLPVPQQIEGRAIADQSYLYKPPSEGRKLIQSNILLSDSAVGSVNLATIQTYDYRKDARLNAKSKTTVGSIRFVSRRLNDIDSLPVFGSFLTAENGLKSLLPPAEDNALDFVIEHSYQEFVYDLFGRAVLQIDGELDVIEKSEEIVEGVNRIEQKLIRRVDRIQGTEFDDTNQQRKIFEFLPPDVVDLRPNAPLFLSVANKDQRLLEQDFRGKFALQRESLLDEQGRVWLQSESLLSDSNQKEIFEHGYGYGAGLSSLSQLVDDEKKPKQFRIYDGDSLLAILGPDFQVLEVNINEPGSNVRLARAKNGQLEFTHADQNYQPIMTTKQEVLDPLVTEPDVQVSTLESLRLNTVDFVVGWGDAFTAGWTTRFNKWVGNDWPVYNETTYNVGWGLGMAHGLAVGVKGGGAMARSLKGGSSIGLGLGAAAAYTVAMDVDAVAKSSYALATGTFHWTDALGFLPILGWGISSKTSKAKDAFNDLNITREEARKFLEFNRRMSPKLIREDVKSRIAEDPDFLGKAMERFLDIFDEVVEEMGMGHLPIIKKARYRLSLDLTHKADDPFAYGQMILFKKDGMGNLYKWSDPKIRMVHTYDDFSVWVNPGLFLEEDHIAENILRFVISHETGHVPQHMPRRFIKQKAFLAEIGADRFAMKYMKRAKMDMEIAKYQYKVAFKSHVREAFEFGAAVLVGGSVAGVTLGGAYGLYSYISGE